MKNQTSFLYYLILRALIITLCIMLMEVMFFNEVHAGVRVQQSNITYLGSSALPVPTGSCSESPSENDYAPGLAYNPSGNGGAGSFYLSGSRNTACLAEIAIPTVGSTPTLLQGWQYDPWAGAHYTLTPSGVCSEGCFIGGLAVYNNTLYANVFSYYSNGVTSAQFTHSLTLSNTAGNTGPNVIGSSATFQDHLNGWITQVPTEHQTALGGAWVMGNGFNSVISRTSFGPALAVITPGANTAPTWLMRYDGGDAVHSMVWAGNAEFPACTGSGNRCTWDTQDVAGGQALANGTTKVGGMTFINGTDTLLVAMSSGTGTVCYKDGCSAGNMDTGCSPPAAGHSAAPTKYIFMLFDVDDLAAAKAGSINPWDVTPYAAFSVSTWSDWNSSCNAEWHTLGVHFIRDSPTSSTGKLYLYRARNNSGQMHTPTMHIYSVDGLGTGGGVPVANFTCTPLTLQAPASTTCTDSSTNTPTSWSWSGDCGTSTSQNPVLSCTSGGLKDICLIATNGDGSSSQFCRTDYVTSRYRKPTSKPKRYE